MDSQSLKQAVADEAIAHISENFRDNLVVGIGTGSTAECFISSLPRLKDRIEFTVSSSERSTALLFDLGFEVRDLNETNRVDVYVDGADEATRDRHLIKGGGAALTEKKLLLLEPINSSVLRTTVNWSTTWVRFHYPWR